MPSAPCRYVDGRREIDEKTACKDRSPNEA
jgi:hypothetical protein